MPKPAATPGASSSTRTTPKAKARPELTELETAPDWVVPRPPEGYMLRQFTNPDYRDSLFTASLWMNTTGHFLLSTMQGPMALNAAVNVWSQYLRRIASYGCMVFGICNPRVVYETVAAKIPEDDWLKL